MPSRSIYFVANSLLSALHSLKLTTHPAANTTVTQENLTVSPPLSSPMAQLNERDRQGCLGPSPWSFSSLLAWDFPPWYMRPGFMNVFAYLCSCCSLYLEHPSTSSLPNLFLLILPGSCKFLFKKKEKSLYVNIIFMHVNVWLSHVGKKSKYLKI